VANLFVPTSGPLAALLNALGEAWLGFRFAVLWAVGTWVFGAPSILWLGAVGYGVANVGVQLTNLILFRAVQRRVSFRILPAMLPPWGAALLAGGVVWSGGRFLPPASLAALVAFGLVGLAAYALFYAAIAPAEVRGVWLWLRDRV
jgi:O-antigen/teichoic acid export membrane protein